MPRNLSMPIGKAARPISMNLAQIPALIKASPKMLKGIGLSLRVVTARKVMAQNHAPK